MDLETKQMENFMLLKPLNKSIDASVSTDFKGRIMTLINQGNNHFLLNLSQVDFVDSSGLGAMISILKTVTLNNGSLVICHINNSVMSLLNITRLTNVFNICKEEKDGIEILNKRAP